MDQSNSVLQRQPGVRSRIYRALYESQQRFTRRSLAQHCGISMPTLYQNLSELMQEGLVCDSGEDLSTGGRRARGLDIVPDARISLGISVTEERLRLIAADLRLQELAYHTVPFETSREFSAGGTTSIPGILEAFIDRFGLDRSKILGVGITIPGIIDRDQTRIFFAPTLGLKDVPIGEFIRGIPYPVRVSNDGTASGHAEGFVRGGSRNLAYLSLENGVGGAVLLNGALYEGENARSGEFGHICVDPGGLTCTCGRRGCLEAYCSAKRITEGCGISLEEFFAGVEEHDPEYESVLYGILRHLATGINSIRMSLDCDVVLGGFLSEFLQPYLPVLRQYVEACSPFSEDAGYVQLSKLRRHITPLGAALFFIRDFIAEV